MTEHSADIIPLLLWLIVMVGGALLSLVLWIGRRLQNNVDELPGKISEQVGAVHAEILARMDDMNKTHKKLETDMRGSLSEIDRRVVRLEVRCNMKCGTT